MFVFCFILLFLICTIYEVLTSSFLGFYILYALHWSTWNCNHWTTTLDRIHTYTLHMHQLWWGISFGDARNISDNLLLIILFWEINNLITRTLVYIVHWINLICTMHAPSSESQAIWLNYTLQYQDILFDILRLSHLTCTYSTITSSFSKVNVLCSSVYVFNILGDYYNHVKQTWSFWHKPQ